MMGTLVLDDHLPVVFDGIDGRTKSPVPPRRGRYGARPPHIIGVNGRLYLKSISAVVDPRPPASATTSASVEHTTLSVDSDSRLIAGDLVRVDEIARGNRLPPIPGRGFTPFDPTGLTGCPPDTGCVRLRRPVCSRGQPRRRWIATAYGCTPLDRWSIEMSN